MPVFPTPVSPVYADNLAYAALDIPGFRSPSWVFMGRSYLIPVAELKHPRRGSKQRLTFEEWARVFMLAQEQERLRQQRSSR